MNNIRENSGYKEALKHPIDPSVYFFQGDHLKDRQKINARMAILLAGDLDSNRWGIWNKEVKGVIASCTGYNNILLAVDGREARPPAQTTLGTDPFEPITDYFFLPGHPSELTKGKLFLLKGDNQFIHLPNAVLPDVGIIPDPIKEKMTRLEEEYIQATANQIEFDLALQTGIGITGSLLLDYAGKAFEQQVQGNSGSLLRRREFLIGAGGIILAHTLIGFGRDYLNELAAYSKNEREEKAVQKIEGITQQKIIHPAWLDRTEALFAKVGDKKFAGTKGVLVGYEHGNAGEDAILAYAQLLLTVAKDIYAEYYHTKPVKTSASVINSVLDYYTQYDIVQVTDIPNDSSSIEDRIYESVQPVGTFHSPTVEQAIAPLRPRR